MFRVNSLTIDDWMNSAPKQVSEILYSVFNFFRIEFLIDAM